MKLTHQQGDPRSLRLLDQNARFMRHETFQTLVANIRRDGVLSQWPFVYRDHTTGERTVYSGNHRVQAAIEAGLDVIDWTECDTPMSRSELVALQLSHNAISGEDDPTILKTLYESLDDVDMRVYSGLDDKTLNLLDQVDVSALGEANLDFQTVTVVFLPTELDTAKQALQQAVETTNSREYWLAAYPDYDQLIDALDDTRAAHKIGNTATALGLILHVFREHATDLQTAWLHDTGEPRHTGNAPITSLTGYTMPTKDAAHVHQALTKRRKAGTLPHPWQALTEWADQQ